MSVTTISSFDGLQVKELPEVDDQPKGFYGTPDGWTIDYTENMSLMLSQINMEDNDRERVDNLLAKGVPGSFIKLPYIQTIVVILGKEED